jgi:hypothetical protein
MKLFLVKSKILFVFFTITSTAANSSIAEAVSSVTLNQEPTSIAFSNGVRISLNDQGIAVCSPRPDTRYEEHCKAFNGLGSLVWIKEENSMVCAGRADGTVYCGSSYQDWNPKLTKMALKAASAAKISFERFPLFIQNGKLAVDKTYTPEYGTPAKVEAFERFVSENFNDLTSIRMVLVEGPTVCAVSDATLRCRANWADGGTTDSSFEEPLFEANINSAQLFDQGFCAQDSTGKLTCWKRQNILSPLKSGPVGTTTLKPRTQYFINKYNSEICLWEKETDRPKCDTLERFFEVQKVKMGRKSKSHIRK